MEFLKFLLLVARDTRPNPQLVREEKKKETDWFWPGSVSLGAILAGKKGGGEKEGGGGKIKRSNDPSASVYIHTEDP